MNNVEVYGIMPQITTSNYYTTNTTVDGVKVTQTKHLETPTGVTWVETVQWTRYDHAGRVIDEKPQGQFVDIVV